MQTEQLIPTIDACAHPRVAAIAAMHAMLDHPWTDDELRGEMIQAVAKSLGLDVDGG